MLDTQRVLAAKVAATSRLYYSATYCHSKRLHMACIYIAIKICLHPIA